MSEVPTVHPASDSAHVLFKKLMNDGKLMNWDTAELSESDTRSKLIDPIFKDVLGWRENEILREEPTTLGFADYLFTSNYNYFHVEAKRTLPRFQLNVPSRTRLLKLTGPHLLGNQHMKVHVEQAAKYSFDLGTDVSVLTNGSQFIAFRVRQEAGRSWRDGSALVWHDHDDILSDFSSFYNLLARECVLAGSLTSKFSQVPTSLRHYHSPLEFIHNSDQELVRNPFYDQIAPVFAPILTDQPENAALQEEIIRHCYITTPLADESNDQIDSLLRDIMPRFLEDAGVANIDPNDKGRRSFGYRVIDDLKSARPGTYILTGGTGSGKTTFLRRFTTVVQPEFISSYCVWLHIDYLSIGSVDKDHLAETIELYANEKILEVLKSKYPEFVPSTGEQLREIFADEIKEAETSLLFGVDKTSDEWRREVNGLVDRLRRDNTKFINALLRNVNRKGRCVVFALDNTDQQGEEFQQTVFLFSQKLTKQYNTVSIVSLREEKFFAAHARGVFSAYGARKFHIGSPDLKEVLLKRLDYGLTRYKLARTKDDDPVETERIVRIINSLIHATTGKKSTRIVQMLACVSNGDMRYALEMFREFISSGNTDVKKIQDIVDKGERYVVPFHEFVKSAILGKRRYYKSSESKIVNVYAPSSAPSASHLTACRIFSRLTSSSRASSRYGEGFVLTRDLLREWSTSFGVTEDFVLTSELLLRKGLLESEPPRINDLSNTEALRISAAGLYYWKYFVRSFAYLDLVFVDTPLASRNLAEDLAKGAEVEKHSMSLRDYMRNRIRRVILFVKYLVRADAQEMEAARKQNGPYTTEVTKFLLARLRIELPKIKKKTGA